LTIDDTGAADCRLTIDDTGSAADCRLTRAVRPLPDD
jgi:hypothetical protein